MKKYTFRLETVLRVRKFKEESCRMELGRLISDMTRLDNQLAHDQREIQNYFKIQEAAMKNGVSGSQIQAFPMLIAAKEKNIQLLQRDKKKQDLLIAQKKQELAVLRGELKVMQNMKDKDFEAYRKATNKEIDQKVEEQTQNWMQFKERKA
jgi:flagellar export protein FliJ